MTEYPRNRTVKPIKKGIATKDIKLLLCITIFLGSVLLKYTDSAIARQLQQQVAGILRGGADVSQVMEVVGHVADGEAVQEVFGKTKVLKDVLAQTSNIPNTSVAQKETSERPKNTEESIDSPTEEMPEYAENGGFAEDLEDRENTLFPKTADETAYMMNFEHVAPVEATLTSTYGGRVHPLSGKSSFHFGLDLAAPKDTPIGAMADGTVRETGNGSYGNYIIVDHADGFSTLYAHCNTLVAKKADTVRAGQEIAKVGATGNATGNHLHLEVWRDGKALNPLHYVTY